jgi:acyl-CoA thioester hydrolase
MPFCVLETFRLIDRFVVPFHSIDMLRHVNHAEYVVWAESVRARYMAEVLETDITGLFGGIIAKLVVDYERQLEYLEPVAVGCRVSRFGTKSFDMLHEVWSERSGKRAATIVGTMVAFDYAANTSIVIPAQWRERVAAFEAVPVQ